MAAPLSGCGYNDVITLDEGVKANWAEVENQYKRRADLVPNLVSVVKGAANFEQETLTKVVEARSKVAGMKVDASTIDDPEKAEEVRGGAERAVRLAVAVAGRGRAVPDPQSHRQLS